MNNKNNTRILLGAIAALGLSAPSAFAAGYTLVPGGTQDWNSNATWSPSTGAPGTALTADTATVSGNFTSINQVVNISSTLTTGLTALTLGDTSATSPGSTTIGTSGGSLSLAASANITSAGTSGAINTVSAPVTLFGGLNFVTGSTNAFSISGKITPSASGARTIENASGQAVTLGAIDLSAGSTTSLVTIRTGNNAGNSLILNGTIADGSSVPATVLIGSRYTVAANPNTIQINGTNTYTGNTTLGIAANTGKTIFLINSDQAFGLGTGSGGKVIITGGSGSTQVFQAVGSDRTITKSNIDIQRNIAAQGNLTLTFAATTIQSNSVQTHTNDITAAGKTLTLGVVGGNYYLNNNNTDPTRGITFAGAGTTVVKSNISDTTTLTADVKYTVGMSGNGTLVLAGTNAYQGGTRISSTGTVQIGNGGTTGSLSPGNSLTPVVSGTAAGTLAFNRSDAVSTTVTANGPIGIAQKGAGALTLSNSQFNSGSNVVGDGVSASTLLVNGAGVSASSTTSAATIVSAATSGLNVTLNGSDTVAGLNLKVGQPVTISGNTTSSSYIHSISGNTLVVFGATLLPAANSQISFGAGSALGTGTTTVNAGSTLGGSGTVAGAVTLNSATIGNSGNTLTLSSTLTPTGTSNVASGSTVNVGGGTTIASGTFTVNGTLGGTTVINGGTVIAANNNAFSGSVTINAGGKLSIGTGVTIGNAITLAGGTLALAGGTYAPVLGAASSYSSVIPLTSSFAGGKPDTTASLIGGTTGGSRTVSTSFSDTSTASNDSLRFSDVLSLSGTGGDIFVLQVSVSGVSDNTWIGWLYNGSWVNAVNGNVGSVGSSALSAYAGSFASSGAAASADYLGSYGYDSAGGTVWAVIDHNSDFAAIPEPSTCAALAGLGILGLAAYRRRRSRA